MGFTGYLRALHGARGVARWEREVLGKQIRLSSYARLRHQGLRLLGARSSSPRPRVNQCLLHCGWRLSTRRLGANPRPVARSPSPRSEMHSNGGMGCTATVLPGRDEQGRSALADIPAHSLAGKQGEAQQSRQGTPGQWQSIYPGFFRPLHSLFHSPH